MKVFNKTAAMATAAMTALTLTFTAAAPEQASAQNWGGVANQIFKELDRNARHDQRQDRRLDRLENRRGGHQRPRVIYRDRGGSRNNDGRDIAIGLGTAIIGGVIANEINGGGRQRGGTVVGRSGGLMIETPCDKAANALFNAMSSAEYDGYVTVQEGRSVISKERTAERQCGPINIPAHYDAYRR